MKLKSILIIPIYLHAETSSFQSDLTTTYNAVLAGELDVYLPPSI